MNVVRGWRSPFGAMGAGVSAVSYKKRVDEARAQKRAEEDAVERAAQARAERAKAEADENRRIREAEVAASKRYPGIYRRLYAPLRPRKDKADSDDAVDALAEWRNYVTKKYIVAHAEHELAVTVESADGLEAKDRTYQCNDDGAFVRNDTSDPYASVQVGERRARTKARKKTLAPVWDETFSFRIDSKEDDVVLEARRRPS